MQNTTIVCYFISFATFHVTSAFSRSGKEISVFKHLPSSNKLSKTNKNIQHTRFTVPECYIPPSPVMTVYDM